MNSPVAGLSTGSPWVGSPRRDVTTMVAGLAAQEPPSDLIRVIQKETEGNPFFVEEVYLHLRESGALFDDKGRFKTRFKVDEVEVPETVRMVIGIR